MKRFIRYGVVPAGIFLVLLVVTLILLPLLINVQKFVPEIEKQVSRGTGRPFSLGPDLNVSFFPSLCITFSDMKIGNPPGFTDNDFIKIRTFEARVKVLPLLNKKIVISRFVVDGLSVNLEKNDAGKVNWASTGETGQSSCAETPISCLLGAITEDISFALLAITDGQVSWNDRTVNVQHRVEDIMLLLNDFNQDRPVPLDFKAIVDGRPVAVEGKIGPIAMTNNLGTLPLDITFNLVKRLQGQVRGKIAEQGKDWNYLLSVKLLPFTLRDFFTVCDHQLPMMLKDSETTKIVDMEFTTHGNREKFSIEKGIAHLDDSKIDFSFMVQDFQHPQIDFTMNFDRLDFDRYLFLPSELNENPAQGNLESKKPEDDLKNHIGDFAISGLIQLAELKIHGGTMKEMNLTVQGKEGIFTVAPATFRTSQGQVDTALTLDLRTVQPTIQATLKAQGLDAESFFRDYWGLNYLRGNLAAEMTLQVLGGNLDTMQKSLSGEATVSIRDGALVGLDISKMVGNPESPKEEVGGIASGEKGMVDFIEAKSVVTLKSGLLQINETRMQAPTFSLQLNGTVNIFERLLNLQMETHHLKTIVGKRGREDKLDVSTLFSIGGTFSEPDLQNQNAPSNVTNAGSKISAKNLVAQKLSSPLEDDVKHLVGKDLVDPAVVAQRFGLQVQTLHRSAVKIKYPVGSGKVKISELLEESTAL